MRILCLILAALFISSCGESPQDPTITGQIPGSVPQTIPPSTTPPSAPTQITANRPTRTFPAVDAGLKVELNNSAKLIQAINSVVKYEPLQQVFNRDIKGLSTKPLKDINDFASNRIFFGDKIKPNYKKYEKILQETKENMQKFKEETLGDFIVRLNTAANLNDLQILAQDIKNQFPGPKTTVFYQAIEEEIKPSEEQIKLARGSLYIEKSKLFNAWLEKLMDDYKSEFIKLQKKGIDATPHSLALLSLKNEIARAHAMAINTKDLKIPTPDDLILKNATLLRAVDASQKKPAVDDVKTLYAALYKELLLKITKPIMTQVEIENEIATTVNDPTMKSVKSKINTTLDEIAVNPSETDKKIAAKITSALDHLDNAQNFEYNFALIENMLNKVLAPTLNSLNGLAIPSQDDFIAKKQNAIDFVDKLDVILSGINPAVLEPLKNAIYVITEKKYDDDNKHWSNNARPVVEMVTRIKNRYATVRANFSYDDQDVSNKLDTFLRSLDALKR